MITPQLAHALRDVIEEQLRQRDPPETRQTFERLLAAGDEREAAMTKLATALREEIAVMLAQHLPFNRARFQQRLDQLH
jgi:hypothetical protein